MTLVRATIILNLCLTNMILTPNQAIEKNKGVGYAALRDSASVKEREARLTPKINKLL